MKKVSAVANEFLEKSDKISVLKLVKLCYIAQGFSLAVLDRPIFNDDRIEAWKYGPVVPSIYHEFKHFGRDYITEKSEFVTRTDDFSCMKETPSLTDENDKKIVQIVWNMYGELSANRLIDLTHKSGTPWDLTYRPNLNNIIPNDLIKEYYKMLVDKML